MKIIHRDLLRYSDAIARFVEEAQACAQLEHSGIVPVHDVGQLPDGRYFYTMKEVRGRDLGHVIAKVHTASRDGIWRADESGWTFRKLVRAFETISLSMAFAHSKGVIHRDLKPGNVMLGSYQEVLIVDWGLVKVVGQPDSADFRSSSVLTDRSQDNAHATRIGDVAGTPAYMSPEQAEGQNADLDYRSDIYALGAILYHILCNRAPFNGTGPDVVKQVATLDPVPVQLSKALRRRPELLERYRSTGDSAVLRPCIRRAFRFLRHFARFAPRPCRETRLTVIRVQKSWLMMSRRGFMRRFNRAKLFETGRTEFTALSLEAGEIERSIELQTQVFSTTCISGAQRIKAVSADRCETASPAISALIARLKTGEKLGAGIVPIR